MANPFTTIYITHDANVAAGTISSTLKKDTSNPQEEVRALAQYFKKLGSGNANASVAVICDSSVAYATGTLTCASVNDSDTCIIGGVTLTAKTSPSGGAQWKRGVTDSADALALVACINANTSLAGMVTASSVLGVVTIQAAHPGTMGNGISLVGTATRLAASVANLAGGTGRAVAAVTYSRGV